VSDRFADPVSFLGSLDAWGIYGASMLDKCEFDMEWFDMGYLPTARQMANSVANSKAGGEFTPGDESRFFSGYSMAAHFAKHYAGETSTKMGRGFSYRENLELVANALAEHPERWTR